MVNRMRHNRSHRGNVRSHHALKNVGGAKCPECSAPCLTHRACANCGKYRGRVITDVHAKIAKKDKKTKAKKETTKK